jgi:hypothetical protein
VRLVPFGVAGAGGDDPWFRVGRFHGSAAGGTGQGLGRGLSGLSLEGLIEHLLGQHLTDLNGQFFEVAEVGAPDGSLRAVEFIDKVFGDAVEEVLDLGKGRVGVVGGHPWLP